MHIQHFLAFIFLIQHRFTNSSHTVANGYLSHGASEPSMRGPFAFVKQSNSGSEYFNYKRYFSIILLAIIDANNRLIYMDVGTEVKAADSGVLKECGRKNLINTNQAKISLLNHLNTKPFR